MFAKMYKYWHNVREKLFSKGITTVLSEDRGVGIMRESKEAHVCSGKGGGGGGLMNRDLRSDQLTSPPQIPRRENNTSILNKQIWGGGGGTYKTVHM
jgi:hypothetical protein